MNVWDPQDPPRRFASLPWALLACFVAMLAFVLVRLVTR